MDRTIACFNVPHLEIVLIRLMDPSLKTRPVAVLEATPAGQVLRDISDEAAADGLYVGMDPRNARALCRSLTLVPHDRQRLRRGRETIWNAVAESAPLWEPEAESRVYADFTGTDRLFGAGADIAGRIMAHLAGRHGFTVVAGVGTNKLVTYVGAEVPTSSSLRDVRPGEERQFLSPLPPTALPQAAQASWRPVFRALDDLNLHRLGAIANVPVAHLQAAVGPTAATLHRCANGVDDRPVTPAPRRPSITLVQPLGFGESDRRRVAGVLYGMLEALCRRLRAEGRVCLRLRVTVVYADYAEAASGFRATRPSQWEFDLAPAIDAAMARAGTRRVRIRSVALEAQTRPAGPAQLTLSLCELAPPKTPSRPHPLSSQKQSRELSSALDAIRNRFGDPAIGWGRVPRLAAPA